MTMQEFSITGIGTPVQVQCVVDAIKTALADEASVEEITDAPAPQPPLSLCEQVTRRCEAVDTYVNSLHPTQVTQDYRNMAYRNEELCYAFADEIELLRASQTATLDVLEDLILALQRGDYNVQP